MTSYSAVSRSYLVLLAILPHVLFAQPANDDCAGAIELIPGVTCVPVAGTVAGATQSIPGTVSCDGFDATPDDDVWYRFTATATAHAIQVAGSASFDAVIQLLSGSCNGTPIVCRDLVSAGGTEVLDATGLLIGQEYLIRVFHWHPTAPATTTFTICVGPSATPVNDDCAGAVTLIPGLACDPVNGTVANATGSLPGLVNCDGFNADPNDDVWYRFIATSADHTISVSPGASFDAAVQLLSGPCNGTPILCRDQVSAGMTEVINATGLTVGGEYLLRVFHWFPAATTTPEFTICLQGPPPPCLSDAGTITADDPPGCLSNGSAIITATPDGNSNVPAGYQTIYVLTEGPGLLIIGTSTTPEFEVSSVGDYTMHTLVYDLSTFDPGTIVFGLTTGFDVDAQLIQGGGSICASLDVAGAPVTVEECVTCDADAGTITADATPVCLDNGEATISATPDGNSNVPAGYETIYVLTEGAGLVIIDASATPSFTATAAGDYTVHTLVYDPLTLDLGIIEIGVTTGFEVNDLLIQGGGSICASLDVAGAPVTVEECVSCDADAGTITADATPVCLDAGTATISATPDGNSNVPAGYETIYVLTEGAGLVIIDASATPSFTATAAGDYTVHTLVYDPLTLDLGIIEIGVTTGFEVNDLLIQGGGSICASLDVAGAPVTVEECVSCDADAGTITADASPVCLDNGEATISATPDGNSNVPAGYETIYVLTQGAGLVIFDASATPSFTATAAGQYTVHTLVYDPLTLDLGIIEIGVTTGFEVNALLIQGGGSICASLDVAGAPVTVEECVTCDAFAGTLTADDPTVCFDMGMGMFSASPNGDAVVPDGYESVYVLTEGPGLVIIAANTSPDFMVTATGSYTIHTLVYDPTTLDLGDIVFGVTTGFDVNALLIQGGGSICASLDVDGAAFVVQVCIPCDADAGTLTIDETPLCLIQGSVQVGATPNGDAVVPDGYEVAYALTEAGTLTIVALNGGPVFTVSTPGAYIIHTLIYDPLTIDPGQIELGQTTGYEIASVLVQGGGTICGAIDLNGAAVQVNDCSPANDECINAIPLPVNLAENCPDNAVGGDNTYATFDGGDASCDDPGSYLLDMWYTFNAGANTSVTINLNSGTMEDWAITVTDGCGGTELACEIQPAAPIEVTTTPFTDYLVRVYSNFTYGNGGQFSICLTGAEESLICDGGTVQTGDGFFSVDICQDAEADVIDFLSTSSSAENFDFILTDDNDLIVAVLVGASLDFNSAPLGAYRVWGISYNGALLGADPGEPISGVTASGTCHDLSSNYVQVNVEICDGVNDDGLASWGLFPNPGNGDFTIGYSGKDGLTAVDVLDMDGRLVHTERIAMGNGGRYALALAGQLARGVYTVQLSNSGGRATLRLMVQ